MFLRKVALLLILIILVIACDNNNAPFQKENKLQVIVTIFPLYDFAREIGKDKVKISLLMPPASDVHHFEPKPSDIVRISRSDIFVFTNFEMEQWAYKIIKTAAENTSMTAIEAGSGITLMPLLEEHDDHEGEKHISKFDPHIWLDFDNAQIMVDNIANAFIKKDPRQSDYYLKNAANYKQKLIALNQKYRTGLASCKTRTVLHAGHWAFAYLTKKYNLQYISAYAASADAEPSPQKVLSLIDEIRRLKIPYIYYEDLVAPRLAQTIAAETGAGLLKLYNGHDIGKDDLKNDVSFISLMEKNLINLQKGLQCRQI
jgi:zinc transport system substrate-binding protein